MFATNDVSKHLEHLLSQTETIARGLDIDLPERRYITTGGAVYDCEQVSVAGNTVLPGIPGDEGQVVGVALPNCPVTWGLEIDIAIVRHQTALPVGRRGEGTPPVEKLTDDARTVSADVAILQGVAESIIDEMQLTAQIQLGEGQGGLIVAVLSVNVAMWLPMDP